jgi:hypothetical protein
MVLWILVIAGLAVRLVATVSWWPTSPALADSWPYAYYAGHGVLSDPQHPAGYAIFLALIGVFTREVAVVSILQHLVGVGAALVTFAAVRRLVGSPWPALVPAAFILLDADGIYLEQTVMSETLSIFLIAATFYAAVRAIDARGLRWAAVAGALAAISAIVRTDAIFVPLLLALALLLSQPRPWRPRWRPPATLLGVTVVLLVAYATVNVVANGRFEVGPSTGWHLYGRAAPIANCKLFTPPAGTAGLCETTPVSQRLGPDHYLFDPTSPAVHLFGSIGHDDGKVGAWAEQAILAAPGAYLQSAWDQFKDYFIPSLHLYTSGNGGALDPQLDFTAPPDPTEVKDVTTGMETFFDKFHLHRRPRGLQALHDYQRVFRFGGTLLSLAALLTVLGLCIGPRRARAGVLMFGVGGIAMLVPASLLGTYVGRYTVPIAGPMAASAAIVGWTLWQMETARRRAIRR